MSHLIRHPSRRIRLAGGRAAAVVLAALLLAGCNATSSEDGVLNIETAQINGSAKTIDPSYTVPVEDSEVGEGDPLSVFTERAAEVAIKEKQVYGAAVHLSKLYESNPRDKSIDYEYARHLRYVGAVDEAERVLNDARAIHGDDELILLETAKLHIARGQPQPALTILEKLRASRPDDPGVLQAMGIALDRAERYDEAQAVYQKAMQSGRPSAPLLNNAAMSHLLSGDAAEAEALLRRAASAPGATPQIQQNLALALSLQGKTEEARRVAASSTPREIADPAVEYYDSIAAVSHAWSMASQH